MRRKLCGGLLSAAVFACVLSATTATIDVPRCVLSAYEAAYGPLAMFFWWWDGCDTAPGGGGSGAG